jgi:hypothetical protein
MMLQAMAATLAVGVFVPLAPPLIARADGAVHDVSNTPDPPEGEESVAVNPTDPDNVLVGANQIASQELTMFPNPGEVKAPCSVWASHDGGSSWVGATLPGFAHGADQSVVFDRHGTAYFSCDQSLQLVLWKSLDGGDTWTGPTTVAVSAPDSNGQIIDRPFLAVDTSGGSRDGTVYAGWESFFTDLVAAVYLRSSTDGGQTWGAVTRPDSSSFPAMTDPRQYPAVGADGTLYVEYVAGLGDSPAAVPQPSPMSIVVARSVDGGATFTRTAVAGNVIRSDDPYEAIPGFFETIASIATDPHRAGHLAVAWPDARSGESRILVSDSVDGGIKWTAPMDVADDPLGRGNQHDHVSLAYLPDGGLAVVWRDRRDGGGAWSGQFGIFARSVSIGPADRLTPGAASRLTTSPQPTPNCIPCEYLASSAGPEGLSVAWEEMRGSNSDAVFRRIPLSVLNAGRPPGAPVTAQQLPNTNDGGDPATAMALLGAALATLARRRARRRRLSRASVV